MRALGRHHGRSLLTLLALLLGTLSGARAPVAGLITTGGEDQRSVTRPAEECAERAIVVEARRQPMVAATSSTRTEPSAPNAAPIAAPGPRLGRARGPRAP